MSPDGFHSENATPDKIPVGISSCLLGEPVRYDGGHRRNSYIVESLGQFFDLQAFCPEMAIGLGVPRPTIQRVATDKGLRVLGVDDASLDVTDRLQHCAESAQPWQQQLCGYIVKSRSPSCGRQDVPLQRDGVEQKQGAGLYTELMLQQNPWLPVEDEERLGQPVLRDNFIHRVYFMHRWQQLMAGELGWPKLKTFHRQHQLVFNSHDPEAAATLDAELDASAATRRIDEFVIEYLKRAAQLMGQLATPERHLAVLRAVQRSVAQRDSSDAAAMEDLLEQFQLGQQPLVAVQAVFKHYLEKYPDTEHYHSAYFFQYPVD